MVQDASNLSGVGHDFTKLLKLVREEYEAENGGQMMPTAELAHHPAVYLYVSKMADMVGIYPSDLTEWSQAYEICKAKAKTNWHVSARG